MLYYVIDAFTDIKFGGNPAGVVIHENLDEQFMQKFATEVRFSETAFVKKLNENTFEIKYFTSTNQVELCGHATIASFKALLDNHDIKYNEKYFIQTLAGTLTVKVNKSLIFMEQSSPRMGEIFHNIEDFAELFSIDKSQLGCQQFNLIPQSVNTGLWDIMLPVKTKKALYALKPNFEAISKYCEAHSVGGIHAFTLDCKTAVAESRNFCPLYGIDEESATGTSTGALTYYLFENNILNEFDREYEFLQGISMDRPSKLTTKIVNPYNPTVMVGGNAVILTKGRVL